MAAIPRESTEFLAGLLQNCEQPGFLTLTAIHPDGDHRTPSRHIPINDKSTLNDALQRLFVANQMGWGAYVGMGLRNRKLGRWRRGGNADVLALPALFADVDDSSETALNRIRNFRPPPSCINFTGGGFHSYWWLSESLYDLKLAANLLRVVSKELHGDPMSVSQILRLVGTRNTKPRRNNALCRIVEIHDRRYVPDDFNWLLRKPNRSTQTVPVSHSTTLNPVLIHTVTDILYRDYRGFDRRNGWIGALCPLQHERDRPGQHFSFNPQRALGVCQGRHGRLLLKTLCAALHINPQDYGGLYEPPR
jgi:hypothetical protein